MQLSENFTLEEMVASSTARLRRIVNNPDPDQIIQLKKLCENILQPVRSQYGNAIKITSGFRSERLNKIVGGAKYSQHVKGEAADIVCRDNKKLWSLMVQMISTGEITVGQLIDEKNLSWIHVSLPDNKHRNQILRIAAPKQVYKIS